uniref:Uncharacterized protein n=1 Tax=Anguilla anguilla TaxID=7936 RepID=A0A0E9P542_ANGAN
MQIPFLACLSNLSSNNVPLKRKHKKSYQETC